METKHTPGPWDYDGGDSCEITAPSSHKNRYGYACSQLIAVATVRADLNDGEDEMPDRSEDEAKANAYLLAAAPDLLAALIRLRDCPDVQMESTEPETDAARLQANAAIAKARGDA